MITAAMWAAQLGAVVTGVVRVRLWIAVLVGVCAVLGLSSAALAEGGPEAASGVAARSATGASTELAALGTVERRLAARAGLLRQLRAAVARADAVSGEIATLLETYDVNATKIRAAGERLTSAAVKADKALRKYRNAKKRFGTVEEFLLAKALTERLESARGNWEKVASVPALVDVLPALVAGDLDGLRGLAEPEVEKLVRSKLPEEARILKELLKKGSFNDLLDRTIADVKGHVRGRAEEAIDDALARSVPADSLGGIDAAALEQLIATGDFGAFVERVGRQRFRQLAAQRLAGLVIKIQSGGIVVQLASKLIIKWLGPKLKEAVRFKGKLPRRTRMTLKGFENRTKELNSLRQGTNLERVRRLVAQADRALEATRFLKRDLRRRGRPADLDALRRIEAAEAPLRVLIAKVKKNFGMKSRRAQGKFKEFNDIASDEASAISELVKTRCTQALTCTPAPGSQPPPTPGVPTSATCPASLQIDVGVFSPSIKDITSTGLRPNGTHDAFCDYLRADGAGGTGSIWIIWKPSTVSSSPAGACGRGAPPAPLSEEGFLKSTTREFQIQFNWPGARLVSGLRPMISTAEAQGVGLPCP